MNKKNVLLFNVNIYGMTYAIRRPVDNKAAQDSFDSVIDEHATNNRSRGGECLHRLKKVTGESSEKQLYRFIKKKAFRTYGTSKRKIPATILLLLGNYK